jgi:hypothetical protein
MKMRVLLRFLAILAHLLICRCIEDKQFFMQDWDVLEPSFQKGTLNGSFSASDITNLFESYHKHFPEIVSEPHSVGKSTQGTGLPWYTVSLTGPEWSPTQISARPGVLFMGLIDGRDLATMDVIIYTLRRLIYGYVHGFPDIRYLLVNRRIILMPFVNADALAKTASIYAQSHILHLFEKNLNGVGCREDLNGANLRMNFPVTFSSQHREWDPCSSTYPGSAGLTEAEARAINDSVMQDRAITVIVSLFAQKAPAVLYPLNFATKLRGDEFNSQYDYEFYQDLAKNSNLPSTVYVGNSYGLDGSQILGEISDYLYNFRRAYATSFEIGKLPLNDIWGFILHSIIKSGDELRMSFESQGMDECTTEMQQAYKCSVLGENLLQLVIRLSNVALAKTTRSMKMIVTANAGLEIKAALLRDSLTVPILDDKNTKRWTFDNSSASKTISFPLEDIGPGEIKYVVLITRPDNVIGWDVQLSTTTSSEHITGSRLQINASASPVIVSSTPPTSPPIPVYRKEITKWIIYVYFGSLIPIIVIVYFKYSKKVAVSS